MKGGVHVAGVFLESLVHLTFSLDYKLTQRHVSLKDRGHRLSATVALVYFGYTRYVSLANLLRNLNDTVKHVVRLGLTHRCPVQPILLMTLWTFLGFFFFFPIIKNGF